MANIIIDGHGTDLKTSFNFQRPANTASIIYSYVREGIGIPVNQSNTIIAGITNNNPNLKIALKSDSRIGGTLIVDKQLSAISAVNGQPQWTNDALFVTPVNVTINGVIVNTFRHVASDSTYIRLPINSTDTIKLSDIIAFYSAAQYNFYWCVCR